MGTLLEIFCRKCGYYIDHDLILARLRRKIEHVCCPDCGYRISLANIRLNDIYYIDFSVHVTSGNKIEATSSRGVMTDDLDIKQIKKLALDFEKFSFENTDINYMKQKGSELYQVLFPRRILAQLQSAVTAAELSRYRVRIRLIFDNPKFAALPWEFLYDSTSNSFLANDTRTALSRYILDINQQGRNVRSLIPPLKVLLVISSPKDLSKLDVMGEELIIREALSKHIDQGKVELDVLFDATMRNINQKLREKEYNVLHFIGHGTFEHHKGFIALMDENRNAKLIDEEIFTNFFLGNHSLVLAVLNSCKGAEISTERVFTGIAPNLVRRGIPAVVAMQYSIYDETAKIFSDEFYRTIALGWPIDAAIQTTRNAISMEIGLDRPDFAIPVLYMRNEDGIILRGFS